MKNGKKVKPSEENPDKWNIAQSNKIDSETPKKEVPLDPQKGRFRKLQRKKPQSPKVDSEARKMHANINVYYE